MAQQSQHPGSPADAGAPTVSSDPGQNEFRRWNFGASIRWWTTQPIHSDFFQVGDSTASTTYNTTSSSGRFALGPKVDFNLTRHWSLSAGAFYDHFQYTKVTQEYTGDPTDGTLNKTLTEHTTAGYWDFPILMRYQFLGQKPLTTSTSGGSPSHFSFITQIPSHVFLEAGGAVRHLMTVRTGNDTQNSDNSTAYNEIPTTPNGTTVEGATVGLGLRFSDDFNLKVMPEVRYTLWSSPSFESQSTLSRTRQLEVDLSFVF